MSFKLNKNIKKYKKMINKYITGTNETIFGRLGKNSTWYDYEQPRTGVRITGYFDYNQRGKIKRWSIADFTDYGDVQFDELYRYTFEVRSKKDFKSNMIHLGQTMLTDDYLYLVTQAIQTSNGQAMADYLDQLNGVAPGPTSTAVRIMDSTNFFA